MFNILSFLSLLLLLLQSTLAQQPQANKVELFGKGLKVLSIGDTAYVVITFSGTITQPTCQTSTLTLNANDGKTVTAAIFARTQFNTDIANNQFNTAVILVFTYQIKQGDNVAKLDIGSTTVTKINALTFTSCTAPLGFTTSLNGLSITPEVKVDTKLPAITSISTRVSNGEYSIGKTIDILVSFSKKVAVKTDPLSPSTIPMLVLNAGAMANYTGFPFPNDKTTINFRYSIGLGESSTRLDVRNNQSLLLNSALIVEDATGVKADIATPIGSNTGSLASLATLKVNRVGQKLPPFLYDMTQAPGSFANPPQSITKVSVTLQINNVRTVNTKAQTFTADTVLLIEWIDERFKIEQLDAVTRNETTILDLIWDPELTFVNAISNPSVFDSSVYIFNTGLVQIWRRQSVTCTSKMDVTAFPFDTQTFNIQLRSISFPSSVMSFNVIDGKAMEQQLTSIEDSSFKYYGYKQEVSNIQFGLLKGYSLLTVSFQAERMSTFNAIILLLPLILVNVIILSIFLLKADDNNRIARPLLMFKATLVFSFVLQRYTPPVNYATRIGSYIIWTYCLCFVVLLVQLFNAMVSTACKDVKKPLEVLKDEPKKGKKKGDKEEKKGDKEEKKDDKEEKKKEKAATEEKDKSAVKSTNEEVQLSVVPVGNSDVTMELPSVEVATEMVPLHTKNEDAKPVDSQTTHKSAEKDTEKKESEDKKDKTEADTEKKENEDKKDKTEKKEKKDSADADGADGKKKATKKPKKEAIPQRLFFGLLVITEENKDDWKKRLVQMNTIVGVSLIFIVIIISSTILSVPK